MLFLVKIIKLLSSVRFINHPIKSVLSPCQIMDYPGFVTILTLTHVKKQKNVLICNKALSGNPY